MRRPLMCLVVLAMLSGLATPVSAQSSLPIAVDQRVRVWTAAAEATTGRVVAATAETVQIAPEGGEPVTVAVKTVRRVEISRGRTSRGAGFKKGAIRGAIIMGVLGAILNSLQHEQIGEDGATVTEAALLGLWSGGLFGGLIGGGIGAARAGDKWEQVWP
jgi:hypothetical protein